MVKCILSFLLSTPRMSTNYCISDIQEEKTSKNDKNDSITRITMTLFFIFFLLDLCN